MTKKFKPIFTQLLRTGKLPVLLLFVLIIVTPTVSHAETYAASIAQGYTTSDSSLTTGMAAALSTSSNSSTQAVEPATINNKGKFVGIITTKSANLVTLTNNKATVVVTTSGQANAYVTDVNGVVKKGDYLTVSAVKGMLAKAASDDSNIVGTALGNFSDQAISHQNLTAKDGSKHDVGIVALEIDINPNNISSGSTAEKSFLRVLGQNIAGKSVSNWQAVIALVIFLLVLVVEGSLIYGAVHSTIVSLGRNPLAHDAVYKQLLQVVLVVLAIFAFGIGTIYAVLQI